MKEDIFMPGKYLKILKLSYFSMWMPASRTMRKANNESKLENNLFYDLQIEFKLKIK